MDTMDAFHSYREREEKLQILKDAHIGAFSVICLVTYGLLFVGAYSELTVRKQIFLLACGYYLARILSGLGVVTLRCAKKMDFYTCLQTGRIRLPYRRHLLYSSLYAAP